MITVSLGSHRFESGPTFHYNESNAEQLAQIMQQPDATVAYVNALPSVNATPEEMRQVAAAGLIRLMLEGPDLKATRGATGLLLDVCRGDADAALAETFEDPFGWFNKQPVHRQLGNAVMDSASVFATRRNKAAETAALVRTEASVDENVFVIGLASGGIISAARTFLELGEGDHGLAFVRYSRYKAKDKEPNLYPYPESKKDMFRDMAEGRQVVVYDEDYTTGKTLKTAVGYFANLLSTEVVGVAPVEVERRIAYKPLVIRSTQP